MKIVLNINMCVRTNNETFNLIFDLIKVKKFRNFFIVIKICLVVSYEVKLLFSKSF